MKVMMIKPLMMIEAKIILTQEHYRFYRRAFNEARIIMMMLLLKMMLTTMILMITRLITQRARDALPQEIFRESVEPEKGGKVTMMTIILILSFELNIDNNHDKIEGS